MQDADADADADGCKRRLMLTMNITMIGDIVTHAAYTWHAQTYTWHAQTSSERVSTSSASAVCRRSGTLHFVKQRTHNVLACPLAKLNNLHGRFRPPQNG